MFTYIRNRISIKFAIVSTLVVSLCFFLLFVLLSQKQEKLLLKQVEKQALILHEQIVITRQWVSDQGYLLIPQAGAPPARKLLEDPPLSLAAADFEMITPSMLTRHLSAYAQSRGLYAFNLTNIDGLNPANVPDDFEHQALLQFRAGRKEGLGTVETNGDQHVYRYAAPLFVRASCLACHGSHFASIGDVGGCISVEIPFDQAWNAIHRNNFFLFAAMICLTSSVVLLLYFFTRRIVFKPVSEIKRFTRKLVTEQLSEADRPAGDELKEFQGLCYQLDQKLKDQHADLAQKISNATEDLSRTNQELQVANQQLRLFDRAKTDFFTDISHELRTPLAAIKGAVDIMTRKSSCQDRTYLDIIKKNTDNLIHTTVDLLDYSRIASGGLELDYHVHSLTAIIEERVQSLQTVAHKKQVKIDVHAPDTLMVRADAFRIGQVVANLLTNAIRFSPQGAPLDIIVDGNNGSAVVSVQDRGPGIPDAFHEAIFHKFYQIPADGDKSHVHKGSSGIGLAICKGLIEAHQGRIWVENARGGGSRFVFTLPLAPAGHNS